MYLWGREFSMQKCKFRIFAWSSAARKVPPLHRFRSKGDENYFCALKKFGRGRLVIFLQL